MAVQRNRCDNAAYRSTARWNSRHRWWLTWMQLVVNAALSAASLRLCRASRASTAPTMQLHRSTARASAPALEGGENFPEGEARRRRQVQRAHGGAGNGAVARVYSARACWLSASPLAVTDRRRSQHSVTATRAQTALKSASGSLSVSKSPNISKLQSGINATLVNAIYRLLHVLHTQLHISAYHFHCIIFAYCTNTVHIVAVHI